MAPTGRDHDHRHTQALSSHAHGLPNTTRRLVWALIINVVFLVVELVGAVVTQSLALLSDAGHMLTDVGALALALVARWLAKHPGTDKRTFGYRRAEVLAAFFNALLLWAVVGYVIWEAIGRIQDPVEVRSGLMTLIAFTGLLANAGSAMLLHHAHHDLNVRGAYVHLVADALGSLGAVGAGLFMFFGGSAIADPVVSIFISILIFWGSLGLMRESVNILMEAAPASIDMPEVRNTLASLPGVEDMHDLHVWQVGAGLVAFTGHLIVAPDVDRDRLLMQAQGALRSVHGIAHTTLQIETAELHRFLTTQEQTVRLSRKKRPKKDN